MGHDCSVLCGWTASTDSDGHVAGYVLQRSDFATFLIVASTWTVNQTTIIIASLPAGTNYFRVAAVDDEGASSAWSNTGTVVIPGIPAYLLAAGIALATVIAASSGFAAFRRYKRKSQGV